MGFFSPLDSCHIVVVFFFYYSAHAYTRIFKARITIASVIKIRTTRFFFRHIYEGGFYTCKGKKTLSVVVSNCVNPFKKDVFQFPGLLLPPPIGPLPVHPPASLQHVLALNILFSNNKYPENIFTREKIGKESTPRPLSGQFLKLLEWLMARAVRGTTEFKFSALLRAKGSNNGLRSKFDGQWIRRALLSARL